MAKESHEVIKERYGLVRGFGLASASALNMTNMVGIGPFITIPLIIAAMGGPQCMLGWLVGAVLALCDGLVWAELAAAMPGSGGTFVYLRETFRGTRVGRVLPFLFIWQFIFSGPLEIASGYIGFAQYLGYFWPSMGVWGGRAVAVGVGILVTILLYRRITAVGALTVVLWVGMLITVVWVIFSGLIHFNASMAFDLPPGAFDFSNGFAMGLGSAMLIAMYDFLGYYSVCFMGGEVRNPERVMPRAIVISVIAVALIYVLLNLVIIGIIPWQKAEHSRFIAAEVMQAIYGSWAGGLVTVLILWCALGSVFALLLGYSRVPYAAALEGYFFKSFAKLHPTGGFPHISLLVVAGLSVAAAMFDLGWVISALVTARIIIQFVAQIVAVHHLRTKRPDVERPFRIWLYPVPSLIALLGWAYIFVTSGWNFVLYGVLTLVAGLVAYFFWEKQQPAV